MIYKRVNTGPFEASGEFENVSFLLILLILSICTTGAY